MNTAIDVAVLLTGQALGLLVVLWIFPTVRMADWLMWGFYWMLWVVFLGILLWIVILLRSFRKGG